MGPPGFEPGTVRSLAYRYEPAALSVLYGEVTWLSYGPSKNARPSSQLLTLPASLVLPDTVPFEGPPSSRCLSLANESMFVGKRFNKRDLPVRLAAG